jgi:FKBP-type peptidyl-prolyl cis-trans isomerase (trigger factor)
MAQSAAQKAAQAAAAKQKAKAAKFVELAEKRATKAINAIRSLSKLANKGNYSYTEAQVKALAEAMRKEVVDMHDAFSATAPAEKGGFSF